MIINKDLSSIEVLQLCKELKKYENSFIEKIKYENDVLFLLLNQTEIGKIGLIYSHPYLFLTKKIREMENNNFGLILKKYCDNARIERIEQLGSDRMICFFLKNQYKIVFELFFNGNIILLNENNKIIAQSNPRGGSKKESDIFNLERKNLFTNFKEFKEYIENREIVKGLANVIGNIYAEELVFRLSIDKFSTNYDMDMIFKALQNFLNEETHICLYENLKLFSVKLLKMYNETFKEYSSLSELLEELYERGKKDTYSEKLMKAIETQKSQIEIWTKQIKEYEEIIEELYKNYTVLEEILNLVSKKEEFINDKNLDLLNKNINNLKVVSLDKKNKTVEIEFKT
ncbi:MAG: NFACT family protein [Candidatus Woesearchaeota archaeon]